MRDEHGAGVTGEALTAKEVVVRPRAREERIHRTAESMILDWEAIA